MAVVISVLSGCSHALDAVLLTLLLLLLLLLLLSSLLLLFGGKASITQSVQRFATGWTIRGSNLGGGVIFRTCPDLPWGPPILLYNGYRVFPGVKSGQGVTLTPHPLLVPLVMKE